MRWIIWAAFAACFACATGDNCASGDYRCNGKLVEECKTVTSGGMAANYWTTVLQCTHGCVNNCGPGACCTP
jgi:hypothetical protein